MDSYLDKDQNLHILGTENGKIFRTVDNERILLYREEYNSEVRAIRKLDDNKIVVGFMSGNIIILENYQNSPSIIKIRNGYNTRDSKLYALEIMNTKTIYFSGNYGEISKLIKESNSWISIQIRKFHGRSAIFCLEKLTDNIFITCDFRGGVVMWEVKDNVEYVKYQINTLGNIQCVTCSMDMNRLAMVHRSGIFLLFQKSNGQYNLILEHEYPKSSGKKIIFLKSDNSFIFNTKSRLFKYLNGSLYETNVDFVGNIEKVEEKIYFTNIDYEIKAIEIIEFTSIDKLQKSKLLNVGLIGHTGVGKSTLCDKFCDIFKTSNLSSTIHRKLWIYKEDDEKFIFFNDIAGQLELIPTLLPSLKRSDIILALFKSNDSLTFEILKKYIHILRIQFNFNNTIFLVRTFYNENNLASSHSDLIDDEDIAQLIRDYNLKTIINIDKDNVESLEEFVRIFKDSINWEEIKDWILSIQQKVFITYLKNYLEKKIDYASLTEICNTYNELNEEQQGILRRIGFFGFDRSAVKTLLMRYKEKELIDVIKSDDLLLILNSKLFRNIKALLYKTAKENKGFVNLREIIAHFSDSDVSFADINLLDKYIAYYDKIFIQSQTWLENIEDQRIFSSLITNENLDDSRTIIQGLKEKQNGLLEKFSIDLNTIRVLSFKAEKLCNTDFLIEFLNLNLIADELSKTKGYWYNFDKSVELYYAFIDGEESTILTYYIFSNSEKHDIALRIDNFFRFYFSNLNQEVILSTRSGIISVNSLLYSEFVRTKKVFLNNNLNSKVIKYENFSEVNDEKKILIAYSTPMDAESIGSESEVLKIKQLLEELGYNHNNYKIIPHCCSKDLLDQLGTYSPEFCYYSGHSDEVSIHFEDEIGITDKYDGLNFIKKIESENVNEIFLNSCSSKFILELKTKPNLKYIGYNKRVYDFQARKLGIYFFIFHLRYGFDFHKAIDSSKKLIEDQEKTSITYIEKSKELILPSFFFPS